WAAKAHPEGTVLYVQALGYFAALRFTEAEKTALLAAETPALVPVRQPALMTAALAEASLYTMRHEEPMLTRAGEHLREARALGPLRVYTHREVGLNLAVHARQTTLARQLVDDWEKESPGNPRVLQYRAVTELAAGAYGRAVEAADQGLRQKPDDATLL